MIFSGIELARRLEGAEGNACAAFAAARRSLNPASQAECRRLGGTWAVFDGPESPVTQTFGLGIYEEASPELLQQLEEFFHHRGAPVFHEVSPLAGVAVHQLLCERGYRPVEIASVLCRKVAPPPWDSAGRITVRITEPWEAGAWNDVSSRAWSHDLPELRGFLEDMGTVLAARDAGLCLLADYEGQPAAAASMSICEGVALFSGAATLPEFRRRGLQGALLHARMQLAADRGCDLAMMVAAASSDSQRNAERKGFQVAYTRHKWKLFQ
jgi:GNAT superfamily N-acetyltransferase